MKCVQNRAQLLSESPKNSMDVFRLVEQKVDAKMIREQLNTIYVKHALLMAKKMHDEGDCISDDGITIVF